MTLILSGTDGLSDVDGSAATPAIRGTDANTGIFFGADIIGFAEGGAEVARFNADAQFVAAAGTASLPVITTTGDVNTGIFFPAADTIAFAEGGTEAMRIDSSGNVGIGTISPSTKLDVAGVARTQNTADRDGITIKRTNNANANGALNFTGSDDVVDAAIAMATDVADALTFRTAGSERARIDSSGNFTVGAAAAATNRYININGVASKAGAIQFQESGATKWLVGNGAASENGVFEVYSNTTGTGVQLARNATAWTAGSDERIKDIIEPITDAATKVATLRAVIGKYKTDEVGMRRSFLIAQDVQAVLPEAVDDTNPEKLGVRYTEVIPLLVAAIKEQQALITTLTDRITALEAPTGTQA